MLAINSVVRPASTSNPLVTHYSQLITITMATPSTPATPAPAPASKRGSNKMPKGPRHIGRDRGAMKRFISQLEILKGRALTRAERDSAITIQNVYVGR